LRISTIARAISLSLLITVQSFPAKSKDILWPELPKSGYIVHQAANVEDVKLGRAAFATSENGTAGKPIEITIPQYAFHLSESSKEPVIIVQAELAADGTKLVGARSLSGETLVGFYEEFELLGTAMPK
jgi:hypothetical protein